MSGHGVAGLGGDDADAAADGIGGAGPGGRWRAASAANEIEDVEGDASGGLLRGGHVGVVGFEVPVEDVVVPVALAAGAGGDWEFDVETPSAGGGLRWGHVVAAGVVVPGAEELNALDMWGNQEGEGVAG